MNDNIDPTVESGRRRGKSPTRRRRATTVRVALASLAVVGIGAAITTAAWTDDVFFSADAVAASFDLQGAPLGVAADCESATGWADIGIPGETTAAAAIDITTAELGVLQPGEPVTVIFCLYNPGTVGGALVLAEPTIAGTLDLTTADIDVSLAATTIAANGYQTGTLVVTPPADWTSDQFGQTATITIQVTGTSDV